MDSPEQQLDRFINAYSEQIAAQARSVLAEMRRLFPTAIELVYDNYNALVVGFGPSERSSDAIFSIALFPRWVTLFFLQAKKLEDPDGVLKGEGKVAKHIVLRSAGDLSAPEVKKLMRMATSTAAVKLPVSGTRRLVIKAVAAKQLPRRA